MSVAISRIRFDVVFSTVLDIIDAVRLHVRACEGLINAKAKLYLDTVRLIVATGSGWTGDEIKTAEITTSKN
jgi:hypothetical protein